MKDMKHIADAVDAQPPASWIKRQEEQLSKQEKDKR
jgi:hypothetical protein